MYVVPVSGENADLTGTADRVGLFTEGNVVTSKNARDFFAGNNFYTTAANRMTRHYFPEAVTGKDVVQCLKANL